MITVVIPIHEYSDKIASLLDEAVKSIVDQIDFKVSEVIVVFPTKIKNEIEKHFQNFKSEFKLTLKENEGNFKFQDQINLASESVTTPYFSILEFDDVYSRVYFRSVKKYVEAYDDVSLFLPFVLEANNENSSTVKLINDHAWSKSHMEENSDLGFLNLKNLQEYSVVNITGGVFKTDSYLKAGGLKRNIELTFCYELLLRMCNSGMKVFVIPKAGYKHVINRDNSLFMTYNTSLTDKERAFWFETANKEYYFTNDRVIVHQE